MDIIEYKCEECQKICHTQAGLNRHLSRMHNKMGEIALARLKRVKPRRIKTHNQICSCGQKLVRITYNGIQNVDPNPKSLGFYCPICQILYPTIKIAYFQVQLDLEGNSQVKDYFDRRE